MNKKFFILYDKHKKIIAILILIIALVAVASQIKVFFEFAKATNVDFSSYWIMSKLLLSGQNPYDPELFFLMRKTIESETNYYVINWYPPWSLSIILPFGFLPYPVSHALWLFISIVILLSCVILIWKVFGWNNKYYLFGLLIAFTYSPLILSLHEGQIGILILIGILLFLYFEKNRMDLLAGLFVVLTLIKPHILYLFWLVLLIWILATRRWKIFIGISIGLIALIAISLLINSEIICQFLSSILNAPDSVTSPLNMISISMYGYFIWLTGEVDTLYWVIPIIISISFVLIYYIHNHYRWIWSEQISNVIIFSLLGLPYVWLHDYIYLLIPFTKLFMNFMNIGFNKRSVLPSLLYIFVNIVTYGIVVKHRFEAQYFVWIPFVLTGIIMYLRWITSKRVVNMQMMDVNESK